MTARVRTRFAAFLGGTLLALTAPGLAFADASLIEVTPADASIVEASPSEIVLTFDQPLLENSSIVLVGASGTIATAAPTSTDASVIRLEPPPLEPGEYTVRWTAASSDGHLVRGTVSFTVVAVPTPSPTLAPTATAAATAEPTAPPSPTAEPTPAPTPAASPPPDDGAGSDGDIIVAIAGVALVVAAATVLLLRRSRR